MPYAPLANNLPDNLQRGRRGHARLRLRLAARMVLLDGTQHCILSDLSTGGARVQPSKRVSRDADVVLMWGRGLEAFGKIIWVSQRDCGILFDEPLAGGALQATRQIDEVERLPEDRDVVRQSARAFVENGTRL
jgi:hypothetical protein